jgi:hypothetical protein
MLIRMPGATGTTPAGLYGLVAVLNDHLAAYGPPTQARRIPPDRVDDVGERSGL